MSDVIAHLVPFTQYGVRHQYERLTGGAVVVNGTATVGENGTMTIDEGGRFEAGRAHGIGERESTGGDVRPVLAEAVAGEDVGLAAPRFEQPPGGDARREDRGLRDLGEHQPIRRPVEHHRAERQPKRLVGLVEGLATDGKRLGQRLAHADRL